MSTLSDTRDVLAAQLLNTAPGDVGRSSGAIVSIDLPISVWKQDEFRGAPT